MKENVIDVLMYLFENYMDEEYEHVHDQDSLKSDLMGVGFHSVEIEKAFDWLEGLIALQETSNTATSLPAFTSQSIRVYTPAEMEKLSPECRGFILFLEQLGVMDPVRREMVIDRVMALESDEIPLDQLKWLILLVLFNQPGQEAAFAWMEDLVFENKLRKPQ